MKKSIFIFSIFLFSLPIFADDTLYGLIGHSLKPIENESTTISMNKETITMTLYDDYFETDVFFTFINETDVPENIILGFPVTYASQNAKLYDFKSWINEKKVKRNFSPIVTTEKDEVLIEVNDGFHKPYYTYKHENAYTIPVTFKPGITTTRINYKCIYQIGQIDTKYGKNEINCFDNLYYYYGSGKAWKDNIKEIDIHIINKSKYFIHRLETSSSKDSLKKSSWISPNEYNILLENVQPSYSSEISLSIENTLFPTRIQEFDDLCETFNEKNYVSDLQYYTKDQLRLIRNYFYAKQGYNFKSKDLSQLFSQYDWYKTNSNFAESLIPENEMKFIHYLLSEEQSFPQ